MINFRTIKSGVLINACTIKTLNSFLLKKLKTNHLCIKCNSLMFAEMNFYVNYGLGF
jgi:hypothetical protein